MILNIFNPEHDIALAYNTQNITMPHAVQSLRGNLGFISAFYANDGEFVLVDDIQFAIKATKSFLGYMPNVVFVEKNDLKYLPITCIKPWGWDKHLKAELVSCGMSEKLMPDDENLDIFRTLSSRFQVGNVVNAVSGALGHDVCGKSFICNTLEEVNKLIDRYGTIVAKEPWSSSGRGVRYITTKNNVAEQKWIEKVILRQKGITVEPYFNRIADFAMEFTAFENGKVEYAGLSVFSTLNGKYAGNVIGSEEYKRNILKRYIPESMIDEVPLILEDVLSHMIQGRYEGPLGVDMMIVTQPEAEKFIVNPCVEINLRCTMGLIALKIAELMNPEYAHLMTIDKDINYKLKFTRIEGEFVNVI